MILRLLVLGDTQPPFSIRKLEDLVSLEVTCETSQEIMSPMGYYKISERSLRLAREATPEKYDAILVGNNLGTGVAKAEAIPANMRARTMIMWNRYRRGDEVPYAEMGFTIFGNRVIINGITTGYDALAFLQDIVDTISAAT